MIKAGWSAAPLLISAARLLAVAAIQPRPAGLSMNATIVARRRVGMDAA